MPTPKELINLYQGEYFKKRTDRGYADYTSDKIYRSVISTLEKNLRDLNFFSWEKKLDKKNLLEVGCAAGHAVEYFSRRGWNALGIDIAQEMVAAGKAKGRPLLYADFLTHDFGSSRFGLITHWATLEHLPQAEEFLKKMASLLSPQGKIFLSTCNTGYFARRYKNMWRYLNVPEHVFYFNKKSLRLLAQKCGLYLTHSFSYGSGYTARPGAGFLYRLKKRVFDFLARYLHLGDMLVVCLERK
ncbi:MAG: Ubiquinone biosynthesis O-methyltransferase [Turneriella sp.]|nr:Ubiquinone biosynthesis O-methyltransferase [Turneriella sp.]